MVGCAIILVEILCVDIIWNQTYFVMSFIAVGGMEMICTDLPIKKSSEDILNRMPFAQSIAKAMLSQESQSSFSIGLYGEWGSGKTSLLNMVVEAVESSDEKAVVLNFNPWLCSDAKQLVSQFFKQLSAAIKLKRPKDEKILETLEQYAGLFDLAAWIPDAGIYIGYAGKIMSWVSKTFLKKRETDLQRNKDRIINKLQEEKVKIIVTIDDIDRLSEEEIIAVFQLVKDLADFPNTTYILAFDYDIVVNALDKIQHGKGRDYLEKIIQVPFEIPAPNLDSIYGSLYAKLDDILVDVPNDKWDKDAWTELVHFGLKKYIKSIRDVIRYVNVFSMKYELLKNETNPVDLLGITCLQVFEPLVYSGLPMCKDFLCGGREVYFSNEREQEESVKRSLQN